MSHPASSYPTERRNWTVDGRRKIFALTFQRLLINSQAIKDLGFEGIHLLTRIVLIEDELRHSQPVKMWNTEVEHLLGLKVDAMRRVRQACIDHGWLHYVPGRKRKIGQYWVTIPDEAVRDEWLNDDAGEEIPPPVSGVKPTESQHKADGKPTQSRTPSIPVPDPENSSSTVSDFESGGGGIFEDDANESAVSEMLATKPVESGSGSTAVSVDSSRDASAESDASTMVPPVCGTDEVAIAATIERVKSEHFTNSLAADRFGNRKFGLADQAVRTAIARGHTTASVDAICDFVESRPGFYGAGAVYVRLTTEAYVTDEPQDSWATQIRWRSQNGSIDGSRKPAENKTQRRQSCTSNEKRKRQHRWCNSKFTGRPSRR